MRRPGGPVPASSAPGAVLPSWQTPDREWGGGRKRSWDEGQRRMGPPPAPFKGRWTDSTVGCQAMQPHPCLLQPHGR